MGTLMGHVLPGTFFAIFAIWWGFCVAVKYFHSRHSTKKSGKSNPYRTSTTFLCICCPSPSLREIPLESYIKIICVSIGMLGEIVTGFQHPYNETLKRKVWYFAESNAQHVTMFFTFGLAALSEILIHGKYNLPKGMDFIMNIFAFGVEAFLFHFHLHGRNEIDIHVHTLLVYNIGFCMLAGIWEYNRPNEILATYCRIAGTLLQGAWFYAAGFILYFPSTDPYWTWSPSHGSILLLTVLFIWLGLLVCMFLFIQTAIVWSILKRRHRDLNRYSVLNDDDDEDDQRIENGNNHRLKSFKTTNGTGIINMNNQEENDSDSQIEFEQSRQYSSKI